MLALLSPVPGVVVSEELIAYHVGWLGVTYHTPVPTRLGLAAFLFFIVTMWMVAMAAHRRWQSGWRARYPLYSVMLLSALAIVDTLSMAGLTGLPLMLDFGFFAVVNGFGLLYLRRFLHDARRLQRLSNDLEREIAERTRELSEAHGELAKSEMLVAVGRLAAAVAHEINNPAAIVLANLGYLSEETARLGHLPADGAEAIADATDGIERVAHIVKQLVVATQGVAGHELEIEDVPLGPLIDDATTTFRVEERLAVRVVTSPTDLVARADARLMTQVLSQLISNAANAAAARSDGAGEVRIAAVADGPFVEIRVSDNGAGISPGNRERLFELFNNPSPASGTTGLGLAVAHGLAKAQGGVLRIVESTPSGTTFAVRLAAELSSAAGPPRLAPSVRATGAVRLRLERRSVA